MMDDSPQDIKVCLHSRDSRISKGSPRLADHSFPCRRRDDDLRQQTIKISSHRVRLTTDQARIHPNTISARCLEGGDLADAQRPI